MSCAVCPHCKSSRFVYDATHWDRVCTVCGVVSAYEIPDTEVAVYGKVSTYSRLNYFRKAVDKCVMGGTNVSYDTRMWLEAKFVCLVNRFEGIKASLGVKSFPSYGFVLTKLLLIRGIEPMGIRLPKLRSSLSRTEMIWISIVDATVEWVPSSDRVLLLSAIEECPGVDEIEIGPDWEPYWD